MYPKTMALVAILGVALSLCLGFFSIINWEIATSLIAVFIGIPTLLSQVKVKPKEKKHEQKVEAENRRSLQEEVMCTMGKDANYYDFDMKRGELLQGEISADVPLNIYFMNITNFKRWDKDKDFAFEYGTENVYETKINYAVPRKGTWFLAIENTGTMEANVEVRLFVTNG
jgi:hypothetical protein